jgi:DNA (cytosine-5)-methyltransferase 1
VVAAVNNFRRNSSGEVDERSIIDVAKDIESIKHFRQWHFFAGIGVIPYSLRQAGWSDDREIMSGSAPCQPFSSAGKQRGFDDDRHLWPYMFRIIQELRPSICIGEQVSSKLEWWDAVASDLESADYAAAAFDLPGASIGAYHRRYRLFWVGVSAVGDSTGDRLSGNGESGEAEERRQPQSELSGELPDGLKRRCDISTLAKSDSQQQQEFSQPITDESQHIAAELRSSSSSLGHSNGEQPEIDITGIGTSGDRQTGRHSTTEDRSRSTAIWDNTHWLQCSDEKYRAADRDIYPLAGVVGMDKPRIRYELERGLFDLLPPGNAIQRTEEIEGIAKCIIDTRNWGSIKSVSCKVFNGSAETMGCSSNSGIEDVNNTQEVRGMRLKGYGNAIVAPVMIEFIRSLMATLY